MSDVTTNGSTLRFRPSPHHNEGRKKIIKAILRTMLESRPYATEEWRQRIARMAKKLEARLYFTSNSFEEHMDEANLHPRLSALAREILNARRSRDSSVSDADLATTTNILDDLTHPTPPTQPTEAVHAPPPPPPRMVLRSAVRAQAQAAPPAPTPQAQRAPTAPPIREERPSFTVKFKFVFYRSSNAA